MQLTIGYMEVKNDQTKVKMNDVELISGNVEIKSRDVKAKGGGVEMKRNDPDIHIDAV